MTSDDSELLYAEYSHKGIPDGTQVGIYKLTNTKVQHVIEELE